MLLSSRILFVGFILLTRLGISQVTFMTFNIRYATPNDSINSWENRKNAVGDFLKKSQIDFLGIQEGLIHQVRDIQSNLGDSFEWIGVGRDFGDTQGEHCALFYNKNKFKPIISSELPTTFWLSKNKKYPSKSWDAALPRIATVGLFKDLNSNTKWLVMNTHFDHIGKRARRKSMKIIYRQIQKWSGDSIRVVLMGDFNLPPTARPIQWISKRMIDVGKNQPNQCTFNGFDKEEPQLGKRIDYIFIKNSKLLQCEINNTVRNSTSPIQYISDHYPVKATLE